ncbi:MAG: glycosyltransferase family 39 protein [Chloroflexota bacterium]
MLAIWGAHQLAVAGKAVGTAKPSHALLTGLAYALLGIHDYAPLLMNALASTVAIVLTYIIGRRFFGRPVALLGALLLAVSEYDVVYARSALSESDAAALFLAGIVAWMYLAFSSRVELIMRIRRAAEARILAGLFMGIAFTANYRIIIYIAVVVVVDLVVATLRSRSWRFPAAGAGSWALGLLVAPVAWEIAGWIMNAHGIVLFRSELNGSRSNYWQEVYYQLHQGKQSVVHVEPVLYLRWWIVRQGWPASLLLLFGLLLALVRRTVPWLTLLFLVVVPYAIYVFAPFVVPRNLGAALPFASLLAAGAVIEFADSVVRMRRVVLGIAIVLLGVLGGTMSWRLTAERSGFARSARYVESRAGGHALTSNEVMVFYLRGSGAYCTAPALPLGIPALNRYRHAGYEYAVVDRHHGTNVVAYIQSHLRPVARFSAMGNVHAGESLISSENGDAPQSNFPTEYVEVYRLRGLHIPGRVRGAIALCNREHVT